MNKIISLTVAALSIAALATPAHANVSSSSEMVSGKLLGSTLTEEISTQYTLAVHVAVAEKMRAEQAVRDAVAEQVRMQQAQIPVQAPVSPVEPFYSAPALVTPVQQESPAQAATGGSADAWAASPQAQAVIQCESGGNYSINTGNGYYGAWQFDAGTWLSNGGGQFAPTADQATPSQQNQIAYNTYQSRGWQPWACAQ